jgi:hypothetical protein
MCRRRKQEISKMLLSGARRGVSKIKFKPLVPLSTIFSIKVLLLSAFPDEWYVLYNIKAPDNMVKTSVSVANFKDNKVPTTLA